MKNTANCETFKVKFDFSDLCDVKNIEEMLNDILRGRDKKAEESCPSIIPEKNKVF